jgi:hypothetical protein
MGRTSNPPQATCDTGSNDMSSLNVNQITIDDADPYAIGGNQIILGSGGIAATTPSRWR